MRAPRSLAAVLLAASLALAGCGASGSDDSAGKSEADHKAAQPEQGSGAADAGGKQPSSGSKPAKSPALAKAQIIRTASLSVQVKDVATALDTARSAASTAGGFVGNEATSRDGSGREISTVVLRVPQDSYDSVLASLQGTGKLLSRKSDAKDVTGQVVDVESRISTQRASVARIRALMDRAQKIADVVELESELSSRQADLESLLAQQASLKDQTSLSTITLSLSEPPVTKKAEKKKDDDSPGFLDALGGGWDAFVTMLKWIAMVVAAVAPFAAALAFLYVVWRLIRARLPKRPAAVPAHVPSEEEGEQGS
ncbi:DUF4349 domain-containing protein [Streptomyces sp. NBC_01465]|uniref:DUF4349 domain-containing protein n=1 Tax=Streptomyces sp. NBC_01465 TaxID=2903878 RepID=UPI002E343135|nr:DUF4349 domain-containing protein [Streptomyces sp. NBC_01465]